MSNDQEHRISYKAGITRTPSDFLCQDGELAECINLTTDNEELKPIVMPSVFFDAAYDGETDIAMPTFVYIHKYNDQERFIGYIQAGEPGSVHFPLIWGIKDNTTFRVMGDLSLDYIRYGKLKVTSIGKTLIISQQGFTADSLGIHYYLWKNDGPVDGLSDIADYYKPISSKLPELDINFFLATGLYGTGLYVENGGEIPDDTIDGSYRILQNDQWRDLVTGLYAKNKVSVAQNKGFCEPFFVRAAIQMYDGSYTGITNPILLMPSISENSCAAIGYNSNKLGLETRYAHLYATQSTDLSDFSDIIKDVVVFVSDGIPLYDLNVNQKSQYDSTADFKGIYSSVDYSGGTPVFGPQIKQNLNNSQTHWFVLKNIESREFADNIKSASVFYRLCGIGTKTMEKVSLASKINKHDLENLTTKTRLEEDDYFSHCKLFPGFMYAYNSRLNIANVARDFFKGFSRFLGWDSTTLDASNHDVPVVSTYNIAVTIETDTGVKIIKHNGIETSLKLGVYFFYPDARASHVVIEKITNDVSTIVVDADLEEHTGLNGAYYLKGIPGLVDEEAVTGATFPDTDNNGDVEILPNYIITSEVNNPWVFSKQGYNKVGTGKILAISSVTMALSQDQYGKTPLIVFSESGVWGMHVDKTGMFEGVDPFTRDVLINPQSLVQTDGAVFFVSKRGLMVVTSNVTNDRGVRCVSEQLNGIPFRAMSLDGLKQVQIENENDPAHPWCRILKQTNDNSSFTDYLCSDSTRMAYDYIESRLIISNSRKEYGWIVNLKDGSISKIVFPYSAIQNVVNYYPDYLLQVDDVNVTYQSGVVYSLYEKPREESVTTRNVMSFILTRPMKLSGPVSKASLRQLKNVGYWEQGSEQFPEGIVKTEVWLSDDMIRWHADTSRFGAAAKYYRLALFIKLLPSERLSGTIITSQERRINNMR